MNSCNEVSGEVLRPTAHIGIFGKVGAGNIGNDASFEALLGYLKENYPDAIINAMCTGPEMLQSRYGIEATHLFWHNRFKTSGISSAALKVLGTLLDVVRIAAWVGGNDLVMVPGAGVLEASLPMVPRGWPYSLFLLSVSGRILGTKVAFISVGAGPVNKPVTRWLFDAAARLACYRSYRDDSARAAMRERGLNVSRDHVFTDLAFAIQPPDSSELEPDLVGVGVMAYYGSDDERGQAGEIYARYVGRMKQLVSWLICNGRRVRLVIGDTNGSDISVAAEILEDIRTSLPDLDSSTVTIAPVSSYSDLMQALMPTNSVVAIRYHNVLCALKLCKPTISIAYSPKHYVLMRDMGLPEFALAVGSLEIAELTKVLTELEGRSAQVRRNLAKHNAAKAAEIASLYSELSALLPRSLQSLFLDC